MLPKQVVSCGCSAGMEWEGCDRQPEQQVSFSAPQLQTGASLFLKYACSERVFTAPMLGAHHFPINRAEKYITFTFGRDCLWL